MKKLILFLLMSVALYAQTPPKGYTTNYRFRLWAQGAKPSADSLDQNYIDIDAQIYNRQVALNDTASAIRTTISSTLSGAATTAANNTFTGTNTFTGPVTTSGNQTFTGSVSYGVTAGQAIEISGALPDAPSTRIMILNPAVPNLSIVSIPAGINGQVLTMINNGIGLITFVNNNGSGNLYLSGNDAMAIKASLTLVYISSLSKWVEISRSANQ